ncbi:MAG: outer membrane beta-barrel protein [Bacteroidetes bacterium]|nr:outer membrane beta-barrel protein [Bacteroidota bacterium]
MKKSILLFVFLVTMAAAYSQGSYYVSLGIGAGINTARAYDLYAPKGATKVYPVGLGKGFEPVLRAGIFVNDFIAVELGIAYRMGFNTKIDVATNVAGSPTGWNKFNGSMLQLIPAVVIQPDFDLGNVSPYARVGVIVGVMPSIKCKFDVTRGTVESVGLIRYSGGVSIGGSAALGCDFDLSDNLSIYGEICYDAMAYAPTKGKLTKYTENGVDKLGDLTTYDKEVKFVKDVTDFKASDDAPDQQLKHSYPFNNLGITFGVKMKLK